MKNRFCVGIDEVGRGPVAGPVSVCAFGTEHLDRIMEHAPAPLRDSKKLTPRQRAEWFTYLKECKQKALCVFSVASASPYDIDTFGIAPSIASALALALQDIVDDPTSAHIYLDGGLHAPKIYPHQETIIKGDASVPYIALASIIAKETRDSVMKELGSTYPQYGFEKHMGYGTRQHFEALRKYGTLPVHRVTFLKNLT